MVLLLREKSLLVSFGLYQHQLKSIGFSCRPILFFSAAEFCKKLKSERALMQNEAEVLKQEIETLNSSIK
jgi:hypothetical protein